MMQDSQFQINLVVVQSLYNKNGNDKVFICQLAADSLIPQKLNFELGFGGGFVAGTVGFHASDTSSNLQDNLEKII